MRNKRLYALLALVCAFVTSASPVYAAVNPMNIYDYEQDVEDTTQEEEEEENKKLELEDNRAFVARVNDSVDWQVIEVATAGDLKAVAEKCRLDTWSQDKYIKLTDNIHLAGEHIEPIATFGGIFDGNGKVIDGFLYTDKLSYVGLFSKTQPTAVIKNLTVGANINPTGSQLIVGGIVGDNFGLIEDCAFEGLVKGNDYIGGIAGYNESTGVIINCTTHGTVSGQHYTGGVVGANVGGVYSCNNYCDVNVTNEDKAMSLEDINVANYFGGLMSLGDETEQSKQLDTANTVIDMGGIAGYSSGVLEFCTNNGDVGYEHVGYNVGGIAGRQSGYLHSCTNKGLILGRKDVGGITGQAEPYIRLDVTEDIVYQLSDGINELHDLLNKTLDDSGDTSDVVSDRLTIVKQFVDGALNDTSYLSGESIDFINGLTGAGNDVLGRIDYSMDEVKKDGGVLDKSKDAMADLDKAVDNLDRAAQDADIYNYMDDADKALYDNAKQRMKDNSEEFNGYYKAVYKHNYYYYINIKATTASLNDYYGHEGDLVAYDVDGNVVGWPASNYRTARPKPSECSIAYIKHGTDDSIFPATEGDQKDWDEALIKDAEADARKDSDDYANNMYKDASYGKHSNSYRVEMKDDAEEIASIVARYEPQMSEDGKKDMNAALSNLNSAAGNMESAASQTGDIFRELNGRDDITLPSLSNGFKTHTNSFVNNMQGMSDNLEYLNQEMSNSSDVLLNDMRDVNDSFNRVMLLFTDAMDGALDMDYSVYEDDSFDVAEVSTQGTVADCSNMGIVRGDIDAAGIAGTMAIEYDFDLEGDVTGTKDSRLNATYRTKCVLRHNNNTGRITSHKSYCGGMTGLQEMGTIVFCENYGTIISDAGDYVGGIAGKSVANIRNSSAKGILSGGKYIGGITGYGHNINDCYSMPVVNEYENFTGAIAGEMDDNCSMSGNYFCSDDLAGIDRISYSGMAEPLTYEELMNVEDVPDAFGKMVISFYVDDALVGTRNVAYANSLAHEQYPDPISEEDFYIDWDSYNIEDVRYDLEIDGEKTRYLTTIASVQLRGNNQSVMLVDGKFKNGQTLETSQEANDVKGIGKVTESWSLTIPSDGNAVHQVRLQLPSGVKKGKIYVCQDGASYVEVHPTTMGMYYLFEVGSNDVKIAIKDETVPVWKIICIIVAIVLIIAVVVIICLANYRKKNPKPAKSKKKKEKTKVTSKEKIAILEEKVTKALEEARDDAPRGEASNKEGE